VVMRPPQRLWVAPATPSTKEGGCHP
jgi:hypothetical protein